jgi:hypothetical protein
MFLALAVAAVAGFAVASCGSSNKSGPDMTSAPQDMTMTKLNCTGFGSCVYNCVITGQGDINSCQTVCAATAKPGSGKLWLTAVLCGQDYCTGDADMMNGKCVSLPDDPAKTAPNDPHTLCDPGVTITQCMSAGYMSTTCSPCLSEARNFWIFDESVNPMNPGPPTFMCPMPSSADCVAAKAACATPFNNCLNDM